MTVELKMQANKTALHSSEYLRKVVQDGNQRQQNLALDKHQICSGGESKVQSLTFFKRSRIFFVEKMPNVKHRLMTIIEIRTIHF